jgi:hypothetical protein
MQGAMSQAEGMLAQLGIDINLAAKALILAVVAGIVAALLDEILGLPTTSLRLAFGWFVPVLAGMTYALLKGKENVPGLIVGAVAGWFAFLFWFIVMEIIGGEFSLSWGMNVFKVTISGIIMGLLGVGWLALVRILPERIIPR